MIQGNKVVKRSHIKRSYFLFLIGVWQLGQGLVLWEPARISPGRRASFSWVFVDPEQFGVACAAVGVLAIVAAIVKRKLLTQVAFAAAFFVFAVYGFVFLGAATLGVNPYAINNAIPMLAAAGITALAAGIVDLPDKTGSCEVVTV